MKDLKLNNEYAVDQLLLDQRKKVVIIYFGHPRNSIRENNFKLFEKGVEKYSKYFDLYYFENNKGIDFNRMYELCELQELIFFFKNHILKIDSESGNNNKLDISRLDSEKIFFLFEKIYFNIIKGKTVKI
jgi:hypothetical protein